MTGVEPRGEPWPYDWPPSEHCHWHEAHEPIPENAYTVCGECMHVYATAEELIAAYIDNAPPNTPNLDTIKVTDIMFCPLCMHDF